MQFFCDFLKAVFSFMDVNIKKDGFTPEAHINKIFNQMDTNDDRKISRKEFVQACLSDEFLRHLLAPTI